MNNLSLADIHCDTALEMFNLEENFCDNSLSVSSRLAEAFENYVQVTAVWSDRRLDNEQAYEQFFNVLEHLENSIKDDTSTSIYKGNSTLSKNNLILSVEDARILNGDIDRLAKIYAVGVRILTFLWSGETCIGGSFDTNVGLTEFGKTVAQKCTELGVIPDISHASQKSAYDIFDICNGKIPVIASHSDSYSIYAHPRNLSDDQFLQIKSSDGLVGINLCKSHLGVDDSVDPTDMIMRHIEHYLELGGEDTVCFGCDFDGAETPNGFQNISSLYKIADVMASRNYTNKLINKIFYLNVKNFILRYIKY